MVMMRQSQLLCAWAVGCVNVAQDNLSTALDAMLRPLPPDLQAGTHHPCDALQAGTASWRQQVLGAAVRPRGVVWLLLHKQACAWCVQPLVRRAGKQVTHKQVRLMHAAQPCV
jgi:hypothetical protein